MHRKTGIVAILSGIAFIALILCFSSAVYSAPPGIYIFSDVSGVITWTTNGVTGILSQAKIVDHEEVIASDGSSHTVTVTYPNGGPTVNLPFSTQVDDHSAIYQFYHGGIIPQPIDRGTYSGPYTFRVTRVSNAQWSEATDDLVITGDPGTIPVTPPNETTFTPGLPGAQSITVYFDDVYTNGSLYDNFDSGVTDFSKWQSTPSEASSENGELRFQKVWTTATAPIWMKLVAPASVNSLGAKVRLTDYSGADPLPRVRVGGVFCHVPEGDIHVNIGLQGNEAVYVVAVERWEGNHFISQPLIPITSLGSVATGNNYELLVAWNGSSQLTFSVVGLDDSVDYSVSYDISGTITPATDPWKGIGVTAVSYTNTTAPTFSWAEVPGAVHYHVVIYGINDRAIYTGYATNPPFVLPPGILKPYGVYKYRIDATTDHQFFEWDNVGVSDRNKTMFQVGSSNEAQTPYIDLRANGVLTWNNEYYGESTSFFIRVHDAQGVPGNIDSVKVTLPDGSTVVSMYHSYSETPTCAQYFGSYYGPIQAGTYTITVVDKDGNPYTVTESPELNPIGYPSEANLAPAHNTVLRDTGVSFDWDDVPGAAYYELEVFNENNYRLFVASTTESQYVLPPGILKENKLYKYVIQSFREFNENSIDNGSESQILYTNFFTTSITGGTNTPSLDLVNHGVVVFTAPHPLTGAPTYELDIMVKVTDADGVPGNIQKVEVTYPGGITKKTLNYFANQAYGYNYVYQELFTDPSSILSGTYTITVVDFDGNSAQLTDILGDVATNAIPWPTNVIPPNDVSLNNTTPTITWSPVGAAKYYKVRILDSWGSDTTVHWSPALSMTHYTVPVGVLSPHTTYAFRVYAYTEPSGSEADFVSTHVSLHSLNYHFTTGVKSLFMGDVNGNDNIDLVDSIIAMQIIAGIIPSQTVYKGADVNGDSKVGMEEVIYILQKSAGIR